MSFVTVTLLHASIVATPLTARNSILVSVFPVSILFLEFWPQDVFPRLLYGPIVLAWVLCTTCQLPLHQPREEGKPLHGRIPEVPKRATGAQFFPGSVQEPREWLLELFNNKMNWEDFYSLAFISTLILLDYCLKTNDNHVLVDHWCSVMHDYGKREPALAAVRHW